MLQNNRVVSDNAQNKICARQLFSVSVLFQQLSCFMAVNMGHIANINKCIHCKIENILTLVLNFGYVTRNR